MAPWSGDPTGDLGNSARLPRPPHHREAVRTGPGKANGGERIGKLRRPHRTYDATPSAGLERQAGACPGRPAGSYSLGSTRHPAGVVLQAVGTARANAHAYDDPTGLGPLIQEVRALNRPGPAHWARESGNSGATQPACRRKARQSNRRGAWRFEAGGYSGSICPNEARSPGSMLRSKRSPVPSRRVHSGTSSPNRSQLLAVVAAAGAPRTSTPRPRARTYLGDVSARIL
jgi:hypothetical protein